MGYMMTFIAGLICGAFGLWCEPTIGAAPFFNTSQGGTATNTSPVAGDVLMSWASGAYGPSALIAGSNITISTSTYRQITISSTASGGSGTVSTSTSETAGRLSYWTSNSGTPALLGEVATTTLTATSPLSLSNTVVKVGGSNSVLTIATTTDSLFSGVDGDILLYDGGWFGAPTSSLGIWSASQGGLGADFSGASNGVMYWVNALGHPLVATGWDTLNTILSGELDVAEGGTGVAALDDIVGTANQISVSGGADTIIAGDATLSFPSLVIFPSNASSTLFSTTYASSTNQVIGSNLTFGGVTADTWPEFCETITGGAGLCDGTDATAAGGADPFVWESNFDATNAATSSIIWAQNGINASTTSHFDNATSTLLTATTAWLTNLFIGADTIAEYISDTAGAMWTGNTETGISITYQDADNTIDAVVSGLVSSMFSDADWGEISTASGVVTIDDDVIGDEHFKDDDWGQVSISSGVATVEDITCTDCLNATEIEDIYVLLAGDTSAGAYTWTGLHTFSNSTTSLASFSYASSTLWYGGGLLSTCASGSFLTWTAGQFGCDTDDNTTYTAGDALTLTGTDIDFDGGASPGGVLGGTWASPTLDDNYLFNTGDTGSGHYIFTSTLITSASTTNATTTGSQYVGAHRIHDFGEVSWTYGSTTQGVGTTTRPSVKVMPRAGTFVDAQCHFNKHMRVLAQDEGGNRMDDLVASSTEGIVTLATNITFTAGEPILFDVGTTTSALGNVYGGCTYRYRYN